MTHPHPCCSCRTACPRLFLILGIIVLDVSSSHVPHGHSTNLQEPITHTLPHTSQAPRRQTVVLRPLPRTDIASTNEMHNVTDLFPKFQKYSNLPTIGRDSSSIDTAATCPSFSLPLPTRTQTCWVGFARWTAGTDQRHLFVFFPFLKTHLRNLRRRRGWPNRRGRRPWRRRGLWSSFSPFRFFLYRYWFGALSLLCALLVGGSTFQVE